VEVSYTYGDTNHKYAVTTMGSDSYTYDNNGNQTTRNVSGSAYTLTYDAENRTNNVQVTRLVRVSGAATAIPRTSGQAFYYDGDGKRIKGTVAGVTTTYIGNPSVPSGQGYFEWTGSTSTMKKYYYEGSTRVAMRTGSSIVNYLLGDHLGSTAITTDVNGGNPIELRYFPWGTERYASGTMPTTFRYTGQRLESYINLYWYGSRWYDLNITPNYSSSNQSRALSRFTVTF